MSMSKLKSEHPLCHQCMREMHYSLEMEGKLVFCCVHPECPNYGLLQIAEEQIHKAVYG